MRYVLLQFRLYLLGKQIYLFHTDRASYRSAAEIFRRIDGCRFMLCASSPSTTCSDSSISLRMLYHGGSIMTQVVTLWMTLQRMIMTINPA